MQELNADEDMSTWVMKIIPGTPIMMLSSGAEALNLVLLRWFRSVPEADQPIVWYTSGLTYDVLCRV